jgi:plasmid stabilization system protein ParE
MPPRTVVFHRLARQEYRAAFRWYARRSASAARRFNLAITHVVQRIEQSAEQGTPYGQFYRWMRTRRFPYVVYYEIRNAFSVIVYAVAHGSRRLGYWLRRAHP